MGHMGHARVRGSTTGYVRGRVNLFCWGLFQVNYVARGGRAFDESEPVGGEAFVASRLLSRGFLWDTVRVIGPPQ